MGKPETHTLEQALELAKHAISFEFFKLPASERPKFMDQLHEWMEKVTFPKEA